MARKAKPKFEKLHLWSWMITPAIILGLHAAIIIILKMNNINMPCVNKNIIQMCSSCCVDGKMCIQSALIIIGHGVLRGAIFGGLFASIHNCIRKFFK